MQDGEHEQLFLFLSVACLHLRGSEFECAGTGKQLSWHSLYCQVIPGCSFAGLSLYSQYIL